MANERKAYRYLQRGTLTELNKDGIEGNSIYGITDVCVGIRTLGCCGGRLQSILEVYPTPLTHQQ